MTSADVKNAGMAATAPTETSTNYGTDPGDPSRADTVGGVDQELSSDEVTAFVTQALARAQAMGVGRTPINELIDDEQPMLIIHTGPVGSTAR